MKSALAGAFASTVLTYEVPTEGTVDPDTDLHIPGEPEEKQVSAIIATPSPSRSNFQVGADTVTVLYTGALSNPRQPPEDFFTGVLVTFEKDGRQVKGRVRLHGPSPLASLGVLGRPLQIEALDG